MRNSSFMEYLSELICSQLEQRKPASIPEGISIEQIEKAAHDGQMNYLLLGALAKLELPQEIIQRISPCVTGSMIKTLAQVCVVKELEKRLEDAGVRFQVLKGAVLKSIYPSPELREMSDVDIMVYEKSLDKAGVVVESMGFEKVDAIKHHVIYRKSPGLILEVHWDLYDKNVDRDQYMYFSEKFRAVKKQDSNFAYEFKKEDFYVYMIAHMAKHFYETGCGIRNLVDIYVFQNKYGTAMNKKIVKAELEKCGLTSFERNARELAFHWLEHRPCSEFQKNLFAYMLDCGIYGKGENGIWGQIAREKNIAGKNKERIKRWYYFPSVTYMREYYPWLGKCSFLLPIAWGLRAIHGITNKEGKERKKLLTDVDSNKMTEMREIYQALQLDFKK